MAAEVTGEEDLNRKESGPATSLSTKSRMVCCFWRVVMMKRGGRVCGRLLWSQVCRVEGL